MPSFRCFGLLLFAIFVLGFANMPSHGSDVEADHPIGYENSRSADVLLVDTLLEKGSLSGLRRALHLVHNSLKHRFVEMADEQPKEDSKYGTQDLSLFNEAVEATLMSASIFGLANLRSLARKNPPVLSKEDAEEILKLPIDGVRFRELSKKHFALWQKFKDKDFIGNTDAYRTKQQIKENIVIEYMEDEKANKECVHYIGYSDRRKTITCIFRGSVTLEDWSQDARVVMARMPNPLGPSEELPETVGVHLGFKNYWLGTKRMLESLVPKAVTENLGSLLGKSTEDAKENEPPTRMEIVLDQLREMKRRFPTYSILVQGHSLGGALALVATLSIGSDPVLSEIPPDAPPEWVPVTCITVGNPKPGDGDFCRAMEHLERTKKLRCCVIHNTYDVVPMLVTNLTKSEAGFWHPGWRVLLYKRRCEFGRGRENKAMSHLEPSNDHPDVVAQTGCCGCRPKSDEDNRSAWEIPAGFNPIQAAKNLAKNLNVHDHREYLERLLNQQEQLEKIRLNDFYQDMWSETVESKVKQNLSNPAVEEVEDIEEC